MLIFTTDKTRLAKHFRKDPILFAYHLADLDDRFFPFCQWGVSHKSYTQIDEAILVYSPGTRASVLAFGLTKAFESLLTEMLDLLPNQFFCHFQRGHRSILESAFIEQPLGSFNKMKLESFVPAKQSLDSKEQLITLTTEHTDQLLAFFQQAYPNNYFDPMMLATNRYIGLIKNEKIVAVAGVHAISDEHNIAVLGNIATLPEERGNGYSQAVTSHLVALLVKEEKMITLNVSMQNPSAIHVYEKLGFVRTHEYEEGIFTRR